MLKEGSRFIFFNYLSVFFSTIRGIVLIKLLNPASLGIYRLIFTYSNYFRYYNLGLNALAFYRAPPKGMEETYAIILQKINTVLACTFGLIFTLIFAWITWSSLQDQGYFVILLSLLLILIFTQLGETFVTIAKISNKFSLINQYNIIYSAGSLVAMVSCGYLWALKGVILGLTISTIISSITIIYKLRQKTKFTITLPLKRLFILFKYGIINILPGMLSVLFTSIELWLITDKFGMDTTGYYSVVITFVNLILLINTDSLIFLYAKQAKKFKNDPAFVIRLSFIALAVIAVICFISIYIIDFGIATFFPNYLPASAIYSLCFWGIPFLVFKNLVVHYISNNRSLRIAFLLGILLLLKIVSLYFINDQHTFYIGVAAFNVLFGVSLVIIFVADNRLLKKQSVSTTG
jgi:O-antigen/teichoic acid export membrane protein